MNPERLRKVDELFAAALAREAGQRASFLAQACEGDEELRQQVQRLLLIHEAKVSSVDKPVAKTEETLTDVERTQQANQTPRNERLLEQTLPAIDVVSNLERGSALGRYIVLSKLGGVPESNAQALRRVKRAKASPMRSSL